MRYKISLQIIELEDQNYHLVTSSVFPDKTTGYWIVDTGASKTVFDKNLENRYKVTAEEADQLHTAGIGDKPIETTSATLESFWLGKLHVENMRVALLNLAHINQLYSKAASLKICGLLGSDFLMKHQAVLDYRKRVMILQRRRER